LLTAYLIVISFDLGSYICLIPSKDVSFNVEDVVEACLVVVCIGLVLTHVWLLTVVASGVDPLGVVVVDLLAVPATSGTLGSTTDVVDPLGVDVHPLVAPAASGILGYVVASYVPLGDVVDPLAATADSGTLVAVGDSDPLHGAFLWAHDVESLPGVILFAHATSLHGALNGIVVDLNIAVVRTFNLF
jgi:hypothetical protein